MNIKSSFSVSITLNCTIMMNKMSNNALREYLWVFILYCQI